MKFGNRQKGLGVAGWLMLILIFGGALTVGMKLFPVYLDHNTMKNVLDGLSGQAGLGSQNKNKIYDSIRQRFRLNNIRDFDIEEHVQIERDSEGTALILDYEVRMPLVSNVDLVADFNEQYRLRD